MDVMAATGLFTSVALRKESVDRNVKIMSVLNGLSVALRKESVDRNNRRLGAVQNTKSRSPQGERG